MADDTVTIEMSVKSAEALAAYKRNQDALKAIQSELRNAKHEYGELAKAQQDTTKIGVDGLDKLSKLGKQAYDNQVKWENGLKTLAKQRSDAAVKAAEAEEQAAEKAHEAWEKTPIGELTEKIGTMAASWVGIEKAIDLATDAAKEFRDANREVLEEQAEVTVALDQQFRHLAVQAGLKEAEKPEFQKKLFEIAEKYKTGDVGALTEIAAELIGGGVAKENVLESTESVVAGLRASGKQLNQLDPRMQAAALTAFAIAQTGKARGEVSADEIEKAVAPELIDEYVKDVQGLFMKSKMQAADIQEFVNTGGAAAAASAGVSAQESLAIFAMLRHVDDAQVAGTAMKNLFTKIQSLGAHKEKVAALAEIGLTPEEIDLEGEAPEEALGRLRDALANVGQAKRATILEQLFGNRGSQGISTLLNQAAEIQKYVGFAADRSAFESSLKEMTTGAAAAKAGGQVLHQKNRMAGPGAVDALMEELIEHMIPEQDVRGKLAAESFKYWRSWGLSQQTAAGIALGKYNPWGAGAPEGLAAHPGMLRERLNRQVAEEYGTEEEPAETREAVAPVRAAAPQENLGATNAARQAEYARRAQAAKDDQQRAADQKTADKLAKQLAAIDKQLADANRTLRHSDQRLAEDDEKISRYKRQLTAADKQLQQAKRFKEHTLDRDQEKSAELRERLRDAERDRQEHVAYRREKIEEQNRLLERQNQLLEQIAANTGVKATNDRTFAGRAARVQTAQRPPAQIGSP